MITNSHFICAASRDQQSHPDLERRRDLLALRDAHGSGIEAVSGSAVHDAVVHDVVFPLSVAPAQNRIARVGRGDRRSRAQRRHQDPESVDGLGAAGLLSARPRMVDQSWPPPAAGRGRRPDLRDGFLEALPALVASQQRPHHQQGVRASRRRFFPSAALQVFHADMFDCAAGDVLHEAAQAFMAAASQYGFLISCESRISLHNSGSLQARRQSRDDRARLHGFVGE